MIRLARVNTADEVIELLGDVEGLAELASTTTNAVYNWKSGGKFPADTYLLIQDALETLGKIAPDDLWPMRQPNVKVRKKKKK
jgi:hypothetical protein